MLEVISGGKEYRGVKPLGLINAFGRECAGENGFDMKLTASEKPTTLTAVPRFEVLDLSLTTAIDPCTVMLPRRVFGIAFVRFNPIRERRVGSVLGRLRPTD